MWVKKTTQYGGVVRMLLLNKTIKKIKINYPQNNVGGTHGFKTMCKAS